jgi:hypothetical protein
VGPNGACFNSFPSFNDLQGQINACPSSASWNYGQNATFQLRNMPAPAHGFMTGENPMSFDLANPERFRPLTHLPIAPQKINNGIISLNSNGLTSYNQQVTSSLSNIKPNSLSMFTELPPTNFNSSYCGTGYQNCYYKDGMTKAGEFHDGCVSSDMSCSSALSNL